MSLMELFAERGMGEVRLRVENFLRDSDAFDSVMESVRSHGLSAGARMERTMDGDAAKAIGASFSP